MHQHDETMKVDPVFSPQFRKLILLYFLKNFQQMMY